MVELWPKVPETEKITINLGYVDLGQIDLLVRDGFYSNRTDLIRTAIRRELDRHIEAVKQSVARQQLDLSLRHYTRADLEKVKAAGETLHLQVLRLAVITADVPPELARETIASIHVLGALSASGAVKAALATASTNPWGSAWSPSPLPATLPSSGRATPSLGLPPAHKGLRPCNFSPRPA